MDEIQRHLERFSRERNPRRWCELRDRIPLGLPALGFALGILIQEGLGVPRAVWWALLVTATTIGLGTLRRQRLGQVTWGLCAATLALLALAGLRRASVEPRDPDHLAGWVRGEPRLVTLHGRVTTDVEPLESRWAGRPAGCRFTFDTDRIQTLDGWRRCRGRLQVVCTEALPRAQAGDHWELTGWLRPLRAPTNPGQFDYAAWARRRGLCGQLSVTSALSAERRQACPRMSWSHRHRVFRQAVEDRLLAGGSPLSRGILRALVVGQRQSLDPMLLIALQKTGLLHLLSLSGLHVGILAALAWSVARLLGCPPRGRALLAALGVLGFVLLVTSRPATWRAAVLCWSFCLGQMVGRRSHPANSLALAALVLLWIHPGDLFDLGWQLSFTCVLGIVVLARPIAEAMLRACATGWTALRGPTIPPAVQGVGRWLVLAWSTGLAAWLASLALLAWRVHTLTWLSSLWTLLALPAVVAFLVLGLSKVLITFCSMTVAAGLTVALDGLARLFSEGIGLLAARASGCWVVGTVPGAWVAGYYGLWLLALWPLSRGRTLRRWLVGSLAALLAVTLWVRVETQRHPPAPTVTVLDVGHGQAIVVREPGGRCLVLDAGSATFRQAGRAVLIPFLLAAGVDHIDAIVLSHPDMDHVNAAAALAARLPTARILAPGVFLDRLRTVQRQCPAPCRPPLEAMPRRWDVAADLTIHTLWPPETSGPWRRWSDNDRSAVWRLDIAGRRLLICGDIEQAGQEALLNRHPELAAGPTGPDTPPTEAQPPLVVAPHHGSVATLRPDFLARLDPAVVLVSTARETHALPTNAPVLTTRQFGAVTLRFSRQAVRIDVFRTQTGIPTSRVLPLRSFSSPSGGP